MSPKLNPSAVGSTFATLHTRAKAFQCLFCKASECKSLINGKTILHVLIASSMSRRPRHCLMIWSAVIGFNVLRMVLFWDSTLSVSTASQAALPPP